MRTSYIMILFLVTVILIVACASSSEMQRAANLQQTRTAVAATNNAVNTLIYPTSPTSPSLHPTLGTESVSPMFGRIAFQLDLDIHVINMDDGSRSNLTHHPDGDFDPSWSPDGKRIVFVSNRDDIEEIYVMNSDGSQQTRLTNNGITSTSSGNKFPAWSPDGQYIAFMRNCAVFIMKIDSSEQTQLTSSPNDVCDWSPAWAPDGKRLTFSRIYIGDDGRGTGSDIYSIYLDGSVLTPLTKNSGFNLAPAWSPDGQQIAFISDRDGGEHLYIMKTDGGEQTRLTTRSEDELAPSWSPDSQWIVFASYIGTLYIIRTNGSQLTPLSNYLREGVYYENPAWAPVFAP